jgi:hypothetical protein
MASTKNGWTQARRLLLGALAALPLFLGLASCGGGGGGGSEPPVVQPPAVDPQLDYGNAGFQTVLRAVPVGSGGGGGGGGGGAATSLTLHYKRTAADYTGWTLHVWDAAVETAWTAGLTPASTDSFGQVFTVPLRTTSGNVGYILHQGDTKDVFGGPSGGDQTYALQAGANEIWRVQGDSTTYRSNPTGAARPDINKVRVHYKRFTGDYARWGLHLWATSGLDAAAVGTLAIDQWTSPVAFSAMPGYSVGADEIVFDVPVLNPTATPAARRWNSSSTACRPTQTTRTAAPTTSASRTRH